MTLPAPRSLSEHDIQPDDTLVFVHIPKAGGITLGTLIDPLWLPGSRCPEYMTLGVARLPREQLASYHSFIGHITASALAQLLPPGFRCITFLREPLSRHISLLRMLKRIGASAAEGQVFTAHLQIGNPLLVQILQAAMRDGGQTLKDWREKPLEALIEDDDLQRAQGLINGQVRYLSLLRPAGAGIAGQPGLSPAEAGAALLQSAIQNLDHLLCFGLTEQYQDSLYLLSHVFGWRPIPDALRLNEAPEALPAGALPASTLDRLAAYNDLDLRLYEHARNRFAEYLTAMSLDLLERYSSKAQAHLKPPLPADVMVSLLEEHYRARLRARRTLPEGDSTALRFTFDQPLVGAFGWQRREISPEHGSFRWTGPGREASLDLQPITTTEPICLRLKLVAGAAPGILDGLTLAVNGTPVPFQLNSHAAGISMQASIPAEVVCRLPYLRITLQTPFTAAPSSLDPSNPDPRLLGVAVTSVEQTRYPEKEN